MKFGATHSADGYSYANVKDPDKNSVSVSSRSYRNSNAVTHNKRCSGRG